MIEWRSIDGHYEVSNDGRVRKTDGTPVGTWERDGYVRVRLSKPRRLVKVHRLVAAAFVANPHDLPFVNHIDCDGTNNRVENLEWCTQSHNMQHAANLGRSGQYWCGKRSPAASLTDDVAAHIRRLFAAGELTHADLAMRFSTSRSTVGRIVRGTYYNRVEAIPHD